MTVFSPRVPPDRASLASTSASQLRVNLISAHTSSKPPQGPAFLCKCVTDEVKQVSRM